MHFNLIYLLTAALLCHAAASNSTKTPELPDKHEKGEKVKDKPEEEAKEKDRLKVLDIFQLQTPVLGPRGLLPGRNPEVLGAEECTQTWMEHQFTAGHFAGKRGSRSP